TARRYVAGSARNVPGSIRSIPSVASIRWPVSKRTSGPLASDGTANRGTAMENALPSTAKLTRAPSRENQSREIGDLGPSVGGLRWGGRGTWSRLSPHWASYNRTMPTSLSKNASQRPLPEMAHSLGWTRTNPPFATGGLIAGPIGSTVWVRYTRAL